MWIFGDWLCKCGLSLISSSVPGVYGDRKSADAPDRDPCRRGPAQGNEPDALLWLVTPAGGQMIRQSSNESKLKSVCSRFHNLINNCVCVCV